MFGTCELCGTQTDLRHSHVVSEFFERRLKADAGTPFMRGSDPNRRTQSGPKMWLLCGSCEDRFSDAESEFANRFYHPTLNGQAMEVVWTRGLARFMASITWRNVVKTLREHSGPIESVWTTEDWAAIVSAEAQLRGYLLGRTPYPAYIEHHVFVPGSNARTDYNSVNTVLNMAITLGMPATDHSVYSLVTVPGMVFIALINPTDECRQMWRKGTLAVPGGTLRNYRQTIEDGHVGYYLVGSAAKFADRQLEITEKQRAVLQVAAVRQQKMGRKPSDRIVRAALQDDYNRRKAERVSQAD